MPLALDPPSTAPDPPRTASDRQRDYRRRLRKGEVIAPVAVNHAVVVMLIDLRWLRAELSEDRNAVADALRRALSEAARYDGGLPYCSSAKGSCR
jgi:hypothetical protein